MKPTVIPLFPLLEHVVLPGLPMPYRIFEPRYKALIRDLLRKEPAQRFLAIPFVTQAAFEREALTPEFESIATLCRIVHCGPLPDGEFHIVALGEERCRLTEVDSPHPYRLAEHAPYTDELSADDLDPGGVALDPLIQTTLALVQMLGPPAHELTQLLREQEDPHLLVFRLAGVMIQAAAARQEVLASRSHLERIDTVMEHIAVLMHFAGSRGGADKIPQG